MVKNGKSSGRILFEKGKQSIDVGLRMRIHINNGATAYLRSEQLVLMVQDYVCYEVSTRWY